MQYNFHNEKYKQSDIGGIHKEQFREYSDAASYKNEVDPELTKNNETIEMSKDGFNWFKRVREAKELNSKTTGRATRKDTVVLCSTVESVPKSWSMDTCKEYFRDKAVWYDNYLQSKAGVDKGSMLSVCVHLDETTPHATYVWIPQKDGKLQAKNIISREFLRSQQQDSQKFTMEWVDSYMEKKQMQLEKLEPIVSGSKRQHLSEAEYKKEQIRQKVEMLESKHVEMVEKNDQAVKENKEIQKEYETAKRGIADIAAREDKVRESEKQIIAITKAPDMRSYVEIKKENYQLKEELSMKDKIIAKLKESVEGWKKKFETLAHELGNRIMRKLGFNDMQSREMPSSKAMDAIEGFTESMKINKHTSFNVIPDFENEGKFSIVSLNRHGEYEVIETGFNSREEATERKREIAEFREQYTESESLRNTNKFR